MIEQDILRKKKKAVIKPNLQRSQEGPILATEMPQIDTIISSGKKAYKLKRDMLKTTVSIEAP